MTTRTDQEESATAREGNVAPGRGRLLTGYTVEQASLRGTIQTIARPVAWVVRCTALGKGARMIFDDGKEVAYAVLTSVFGPLTWRTEMMAEAVFEGKPIWVERVILRQEHFFALAVPLSRPLKLGIYTRHNTSGVGPELRTGDPQFDTPYILTGDPPQVVLAAFDTETRAWILRNWYPHEPDLKVGQDGFLRVSRYMPSRSDIAAGISSPVQAEEIALKARGLQRLGTLLVRSYDGAPIPAPRMQNLGPTVPPEFLLQKAATADTRERRIWGIALVAVIGTVVLMVVVVVVAIAGVLLKALW